MKKWLVLLLMLFFIPLVSAEIVFNNDFITSNQGDVVNVEGYIQVSEDIRDIFRLDLDCENSIQLYARMIYLEANNRYFFDEDINLPVGYKGECNFIARFNDESVSSDKFEISDALRGEVFVNKNLFRLGDVLELSGDVFKINNDKLQNGLGIIYLSMDNKNYFTDTFEIFNGDISYNTVLEKLPAGTYSSKLEVYDFYGNTNTFDLKSIVINDKLKVDVNLNKESYLPDEKLEINGKVDTKEYKVSFKFEEYSEEILFEEQEFYYFLRISKNIKSGSHDVSIKVTDEYGNYYEKTLNFNVIPVPTKLSVKVEDKEYLPNDIVEIFVGIYDQADDLIDKEAISLTVINPGNNKILEKSFSSGSVYGLELKDVEPYPIPGDYKVLAKSQNFEEKIIFNVGEYEAINAYYSEDKLKIENIGNIIINRGFTVYLDDEIFSFNINNLKPSEIESYNLIGKVKDGNYNLKVNFKDKSIDVGNVYIEKAGFISSITGGVVGGGGATDWIVYVIVLLIIILVLVFFIYKPGKRNDYDRQKGFREAQERLKKIKDEKERGKPKRLFQAKEISENEAKDFRESMVKKMGER